MSYLDMPFEASAPGTEIDLSEAHVSDGVIIMSALAPITARRTAPALVYRFARPDGSGFYTPHVLVLPGADALTKVRDLTMDATRAAAKATR